MENNGIRVLFCFILSILILLGALFGPTGQMSLNDLRAPASYQNK